MGNREGMSLEEKMSLLEWITFWHHTHVYEIMTYNRQKTMSTDLFYEVISPIVRDDFVRINRRLSLFQRMKRTDPALLQRLEGLTEKAKMA